MKDKWFLNKIYRQINVCDEDIVCLVSPNKKFIVYGMQKGSVLNAKFFSATPASINFW